MGLVQPCIFRSMGLIHALLAFQAPRVVEGSLDKRLKACKWPMQFAGTASVHLSYVFNHSTPVHGMRRGLS